MPSDVGKTRSDPKIVALSFVQTAADIERARQLMAGAANPAQIVAKIERPAAVENLEARQLYSVLYVSNSGSDGASGAGDSPLATIQAALNRAQSGDTVMLYNGTYEGGVTIDKSNITLRSAPGCSRCPSSIATSRTKTCSKWP